MQIGASSIATTNDTWVLKNTRLRVIVSKTTGQIISLVTDKELLAAPAAIVLVDTVDNKTLTYTDGVINKGSTTSSGNRAILTYSLVYGNSYTATTTLTCTPDAVRWDVELSTTLTPDREMKITYDLPILSSADEAFWAAPGLPAKIADMRTQILEYRTTTYLPWVCLYGQKTDHGLSLIAPPDVPKPGLTFFMETADNPKRMRVSNHHLRVGASKPTKSSLFLVPHEGDWRPGLA